jgi:hypothetical protein
MGRWYVAAAAAGWILVPALAAAQAASDAEAEESFDTEADVAGQPLPAAQGRVRAEPVPAPPPFVSATEDGWGIPEHPLYVVPSGGEQPPLYQGEVARIPPPPWPGRHLLASESFPTAWTFPELYPLVNAALETTVGQAGQGKEPVFIERAALNLYLLEVGVDLVRAIGDQRASEPSVDLDLRIPIALGEHQRLALLPGVSFPKVGDTFAARTRLAYGAGIGRLAFQVNGGYAAGARPGGMLGALEGISGPTFLAGALVAFRVHEKFEPRVEADLGFGSGGHEDTGTVAAGFDYFPWGDPRLSLGVAAIAEDAGDTLFSSPSAGALLELQMNFQ